MAFKHFTKILIGLLICAVLVPMLPARALEAAPLPLGTQLQAQEQPAGTSAGHLASKVRRSASYGSWAIGCFENGTRITVLETKGEFYKVDCFDMVGYIATTQVQQDADGEYYVNCVEGFRETVLLPSYSTQSVLATRSALFALANEQLGVKYLTGGITPRGFDCSGLTQYLYKQSDIAIPRMVEEQVGAGVIIAKEDLQVGDLIIFSNTTGVTHFASHVGIYMGNGQFIHASSGYRGVTYDELDSPYYMQYYQCARRILLADLAPAVSIPVTGLAGSSSAWR